MQAVENRLDEGVNEVVGAASTEETAMNPPLTDKSYFLVLDI